MAILIEQQSKCPACNTFLDKDRRYILIPPLTGNTKDPLFIFSDAGVHADCINRHKSMDKLLKHIALYNEHIPPSKLHCVVDENIVDNPKDLLFFGLLTSEETEDLYHFNYLSFNLKNISKWKELNRFLSVSEKFLSEKKWEGLNEFNKLEDLINNIKNIH